MRMLRIFFRTVRKPIEEISKLLGHENISTTMIYAHASLESVRSGHQKHIV